nr:M14 family zinc carboxypeptidase [Variovorax boronicumulans]
MKRIHPPRLTPVAAIVASVVLACAAGVIHAHGGDPDQVYAVKIPYASQDQLSQLTGMLDHPYVDQKTRTVHAEVSDEELHAVEALGIGVQIDVEETARIKAFITSRSRDESSGALNRPSREQPSSVADGTHSCYRTVEQTYATFDELKAKYPDLVQLKTLGPAWMKTQIKEPTVVNNQYDNSWSSYTSLLAKFIPQSLLQRFNLALFPAQPHDVRAIVVGNFKKQEGKEVPRMVWTGGIHAREYAPQEVGTKFIEWLLDNYGKDPNATMMLDNNQYHYIIHNPDGRKLAEQDRSARQRKNTNYITALCTTGTNAQLSSGVDLNRNYPFGWATGGAGGSDGNVCGETFRGTGPASEPETQAVLNYVRGTWNQAQCKWEGGALPDGRPKSAEYCNPENRSTVTGELDWQTGASDEYGGGMFIDLHSNARAILWPWGVERTENGFNTHTPNNKGMAVIAQRLAYHNNYSSQQLLSYNTEGTTKDAFYGFLGAPSYTVEMGRSFYEDCGVFDRETYPENFNGFHYMSRALHRVYKLPFGPDTVDVKVEQTAAVPAGTKVNVSALVDDNRYRYSNAGQANILPPPYPVVYNIASAKVYIDQMPWDAGAEGKPLELGTSDQAKSDFPDATKRAFGQIDTTGLAPGRHMVYVQGTNSDGKPGAVSAAFLDVAEAKSSGGGGGAVGGLAAALAGLAAVALQRRRKQAASSSL